MKPATLAALPALLAMTILAVGCGPKPDGKTSLASSESWCPDGFEIGPADTCFAIPEKTEKDTPILVYLHGMYEGHGSAEEWALVRLATTKGFAVIIPRGKRGSCELRAELKNHFCWPREAEDPQAAKTIVGEWEKVIWQVNALLEPGTHPRFVMGFADGGAFTAYLASRSLFPASGWSVVNGGQLEPMSHGKKAPMILVSGAGDAESAPHMRELSDGLTKWAWPHAACVRPGGHALTAEDVEASLAFFRHDALNYGGSGASAKQPLSCEGGTKPAP